MNNTLLLLKSALTDFKKNKVRTFLTSLGIMIGVLSVVMLIALGLGLKNYIEDQFESMGSNLVMIMPGNEISEGGLQSFGSSFASNIRFDERDVASLRRVADVDYVVPAFTQSSVVEALGNQEVGTIMGVNGEAFPLYNLKMKDGRAMTIAEGEKRIKNVVLGQNLAEKLFEDTGIAVGKRIRIDNQRYRVIGVIEKMGDPEMDNGVIMPYKTTFGTLNPNKQFFSIMVGVDAEDNIDQVKADIESTLTRRYDADEFSISEQAELLDAINQIFGMINSVLIGIGSISLVVGGIGIMNIMYANVTERTKEIGIRRALGATQRDILLQFLTESVLLSLFGGVMGIILAFLIVLGVQNFFPAEVNLASVLIALVISSGIGIFFGVFPARRAASLTPIEAIRYE